MLDLKPQPFELDPIEISPVEVIRDLQLHRLKWSLRHAYENVPHYTRAFDAVGVKPDDLKSLADLAKFPFTAKADLRANYPFGMLLCRAQTWRASMPRRAPQASQPLSATPSAISTPGPI